jgi:hypothetical protein
VAFRGRVRGRLLGPGIYTIVPQPAAGSRRLPQAVAVAIDARGIRPTAPVRWRGCDSAAAAASPKVTAGKGLPVLASRASGSAAAEAIELAKHERAAETRPAAAFVLLPSVTKNSQRSALVFLLALLVVEIAVLTILLVEPGHKLRLRTITVIARHRFWHR